MFESPSPDLSGLDLSGLDPLGSGAGAVVTALAAVDPAELPSDHDVLDLVAAWERVATWATAQSIAATTEFARRPADTRLGEPGSVRRGPGHLARSHADDELAVRLGASRRAVAWRLEAALRLPAMPDTARAFRSGLLDVAKTRVMVEECATSSAAAIRAVEVAVLDQRAAAQPVARLRDRVRRAVIVADPAQAADRADRARAARTMSVMPLPDAMAELVATLPADDAAAIRAAVDAAAQRLRARTGEHRTLDQLRTDALAAPFWNALRTGRLDGIEPVPLACAQGEPAAVQVTVPASVLFGLSENPGELAGYGPIPAPLARQLAADGRWRAVLTDAAGVAVGVGSRSYRPSRSLARLIATRDRRCRFPGCSAPAVRCDVDHVVPFPTGLTEPANLLSLCRRHHLLKHGGRGDTSPPRPSDRADATGRADAEIAWRMPDGSTAYSDPPPIGDPTADAALLEHLRDQTEPPDRKGPDPKPPEGAGPLPP